MKKPNENEIINKDKIETDNIKINSVKDLNKKRLLDEQLDNIFTKLMQFPLIINRLDYYSNSIPLGAFCFAVSFILFGFIDCEVIKKPDTFTFSIILLFGGIGQITAGFFEYIKSRTFPTIIYLLYGLYFLSFFFSNYYKEEFFDIDNNRKIYYGSWTGLTFPLIIGSTQTNFIYLLQNLVSFAFFLIRTIGECKNWNVLNTKVSGILELITGFLSLYLCFSQVLNEHFKCNILPSFPLNKNNEIDNIY